LNYFTILTENWPGWVHSALEHPQNNTTLKQGNFDYLTKRKSKIFADAQQRITYSYNNVENTIVGYVEEDGDLICLYEYRGQYFGTEFLISFSRNSASYKLLHTEDSRQSPAGDDYPPASS
jgi:hypothetical protein